MEKITVVLPFHRNEDYFLNQAIDSVLNSNGVEVELILVDNRPHLLNLNIPNDPRIKLIRNNSPGYGTSLNMGLQAAKHRWVSLMNSDDLISKEKLHLQVEGMKRDNSKLSITSMEKIGLKHNVTITGEQPTSEYSPYLLFLGAYGANATLMIDSYEVISPIFADEFHADWFFALNYYFKYKITYINSPEYYYRSHTEQITRHSNISYNTIITEIGRTFKELFGINLTDNTIKALGLPYLRYKSLSNEEHNILEASFTKLRSQIIASKIKVIEIDRILYRRAVGILRNDKNIFFFLKLTKHLKVKHSELILLFLNYMQIKLSKVKVSE